jgi:hypothetical protein
MGGKSYKSPLLCTHKLKLYLVRFVRKLQRPKPSREINSSLILFALDAVET